MKKLIVFIILIPFIFCQCVQYYAPVQELTGPEVLSYRVGEIIDPEERQYYGLFPGIEGFQYAEFYRLSGGGYEVHIQTEQHKLLVRITSPNGFLLLRDYINWYEEAVAAKDEFEEKWSIVDYDDLDLPITEEDIGKYFIGSHIDSNVKSCGCGLLAGVLIVAGAFLVSMSIIFSSIFSPPTQEEEQTAKTIIIGGCALGLVTGVLIARSLKGKDQQKVQERSKQKALDLIKEARKPRVIETER